MSRLTPLLLVLLLSAACESDIIQPTRLDEHPPADTATAPPPPPSPAIGQGAWSARFHDEIDLVLDIGPDSTGEWTWTASEEQSWSGGLDLSRRGDTVVIRTTEQPTLEPEFLAWNRLPVCCNVTQIQIVVPVFDCELEGVPFGSTLLQVSVVGCRDLPDYDPLRPALDSIENANPLPPDPVGGVTGGLYQRLAFELHCLLPERTMHFRTCSWGADDVEPLWFYLQP